MPRWAVKPRGRCPDCHYKRSGVNHLALCVWARRPAVQWNAETERLWALVRFGDTPAEQWQRREVLNGR